jgi:hypothetical protein
MTNECLAKAAAIGVRDHASRHWEEGSFMCWVVRHMDEA